MLGPALRQLAVKLEYTKNRTAFQNALFMELSALGGVPEHPRIETDAIVYRLSPPPNIFGYLSVGKVSEPIENFLTFELDATPVDVRFHTLTSLLPNYLATTRSHRTYLKTMTTGSTGVTDDLSTALESTLESCGNADCPNKVQ